MNILQICPRPPFPLVDGGAIGIFNITKHLSLRQHRVKLMFPVHDHVAIPPEVVQTCDAQAVIVPKRTKPHDVLRSFLHTVPYTIDKYQHAVLLDAIDNELAAHDYDVVHADHLAMAPYGLHAKRKFGIPLLLRMHNLETKFMARFATREESRPLAWYARYQTGMMRSYEPKICEQCDSCAMITPEDERDLRSMSSRVKTVVIPPGVDLPPASRPENSGRGTKILFLSLLSWKPNVDGLVWFCRAVLPLILREEPSAVVSVVGKGWNPILDSLRSDHVRFVGFVESIASELNEAAVCIVPLFVGSGIRIKILDMFAHGNAVVSTTIGCEGIGGAHGRELLVADTPGEFAGAVLRLLRDPSLRRTLGNNARAFVEVNYRWENVAEKFEEAYEEIQ